MTTPGTGSAVDTDALRAYGSQCAGYAENVSYARQTLAVEGTLPNGTWRADGMAAAAGLGGLRAGLGFAVALAQMERTYEAVHENTVERLRSAADALDDMSERLRQAAEDYDATDQSSADGMRDRENELPAVPGTPGTPRPGYGGQDGVWV